MRLVGVPSSSIDSEPRRADDRAVVDDGDALGGDLLAHQAGEGRGLLAVEIAFEPVADRFVQHDAGPAGAEHDIHFAGRRRDRFEIDQRLAHRVVGGAAPVLRFDEALIAFAAAIAVAAGFLAVAVAGDDRDIDAHQRTDVAIDFAIRPQDFDDLPRRRDAGGHLPHARILGARIGVDLFQQLDLGLEAGRAERIFVGVEFDVGARRRHRDVAGIVAAHRAHRIRGARDRAFRHVGGMGIADRVVLDGAQAEALRGVVGRLFQPAVVEQQHFRLAVFEEQFAVVGAFEPALENFYGRWLVEAGAVEEGGGRSWIMAGLKWVSRTSQHMLPPNVSRGPDWPEISTAACRSPGQIPSG